MSYVLSKNPTFTVAVKIVEPGNAVDGQFEEHEFIAEFRRLKRDETMTLLSRNLPVYEALSDVLVGWSGLKDERGSELPFTPEYRDALLQIPHAIVGLWDAFLIGNSGAARKN